MKKIAYKFMRVCLSIIFILVMVVQTSACDDGLLVTKIEVLSYPNNIVYKIGENALDLSGGRVKITSKQGSSVNVAMNDVREVKMSSNVDFNKIGVYIVTISRTDKIFCSFPIQVVKSYVRD